MGLELDMGRRHLPRKCKQSRMVENAERIPTPAATPNVSSKVTPYPVALSEAIASLQRASYELGSEDATKFEAGGGRCEQRRSAWGLAAVTIQAFCWRPSASNEAGGRRG